MILPTAVDWPAVINQIQRHHCWTLTAMARNTGIQFHALYKLATKPGRMPSWDSGARIYTAYLALPKETQ